MARRGPLLRLTLNRARGFFCARHGIFTMNVDMSSRSAASRPAFMQHRSSHAGLRLSWHDQPHWRKRPGVARAALIVVCQAEGSTADAALVTSS
jgi:hypothetical protein